MERKIQNIQKHVWFYNTHHNMTYPKQNNVTFMAKKAAIKKLTSQAIYWQNMSLF